jgi:transmembrane sensor
MDRGEEAKADEAAARWLARLNARTVTTAELDQFYAWRREPSNAAAYARAERVWRDARKLDADPEIAAAVEAALDRPRSRGLFARISRRNLLQAGLVAAPAGLAVAAGWWMFAPGEIHETQSGERLALVLADGTRVQLNGASRIAVHYSDQHRRVALERGEAVFTVRRDPARPFKVSADDRSVQALGTRFAMRRTGTALRVLLIEGEIELGSPDAAPARLDRPGTAALMRPDAPIALSRADIEAETAWTHGKLLFRQTPLARAVDEVNRYATIPIALRGAGLGAERVDGSFEIGDTDSFVAAVTTIFNLRARPSGGQIVLEPSPEGLGKKTSPPT